MFRLGHGQTRSGVADPRLRLAVVEAGQDVALAHRVALVDQDLGHPAGDRRAESRA